MFSKSLDKDTTMTTEELIDRLENYYDFACSGGPLKLCVDWEQLKDALRRVSEERDDWRKEANFQLEVVAAAESDLQAARGETRKLVTFAVRSAMDGTPAHWATGSFAECVDKIITAYHASQVTEGDDVS